MRFVAFTLVGLVLLGARAGAADKQQLVVAVQAGDTEKVQSLIASGANVNGKGKGGVTPLLAAVTKGYATVVKVLLDLGARVDARGERAATPLYVAAQEGYDSVVLALLAAGADVDAADVDGWTPLLRAARGNHASTAKVLLAHGAKVDHRTVSDYTALMSAARWGCADVIPVLIGAGANVNIMDRGHRDGIVVGEGIEGSGSYRHAKSCRGEVGRLRHSGSIRRLKDSTRDATCNENSEQKKRRCLRPILRCQGGHRAFGMTVFESAIQQVPAPGRE